MASNNFISKSKFADSVKTRKDEEQVRNWVDLAEGEIYKITSIDPKVSSKYGDCYILHIENETKDIQKVWGPARLVKRIKETRKPDEAVYFVSLGQERKNKKTYNNFDIHFEREGNESKIFIED